MKKSIFSKARYCFWSAVDKRIRELGRAWQHVLLADAHRACEELETVAPRYFPDATIKTEVIEDLGTLFAIINTPMSLADGSAAFDRLINEWFMTLPRYSVMRFNVDIRFV